MDQLKVDELISLGGLSVLKPNIGSKHPFDNCPEDECTFYGRDRGEQDVEKKTASDLDQLMEYAENCGCEYFYLFKNGKWEFADRGPQYFGMSDGSKFSQFQPLTETNTSE